MADRLEDTGGSSAPAGVFVVIFFIKERINVWAMKTYGGKTDSDGG
jgi:hypothetical protein